MKYSLDDIDVLITTMERPSVVKRLIDSVRIYYPNIDIYVGDQGAEFHESFYKQWHNLYAFNLPFDSGLSYTRNYLFDNTPKPLKLLLDDDYIFLNTTVIENMLPLTETFDIVGGAVAEINKYKTFEYNFNLNGDKLLACPISYTYRKFMGTKYQECDSVMNFGLFHKNVKRWDEQLKLAEHMDYFYEFDGRVCYTPDTQVFHDQYKPPDYMRMRQRAPYFRNLFLKKHGLSEARECKY